MANIIATFFGKAKDSGRMFDNLEIAEAGNYKENPNKYNVIFIDFSEVTDECSYYNEYITHILNVLKVYLTETYNALAIGNK